MSTRYRIYETSHFEIKTSSSPHVSRTDGGHIVIYPLEPVRNRWDFDIPRAKALMRLTMLAGEAMVAALNENGVPVERINFQDNGNWGINTERGPWFHLHLYGRSRDSVLQTRGEALRLPLRSEFRTQEPFEPLTEADRLGIARHIAQLAGEDRYQLASWGMEQG